MSVPYLQPGKLKWKPRQIRPSVAKREIPGIDRGGDFEAHLSYWKERLAGCQDVLSLPADRPRPAQRTFKAAEQITILPDRLSERLKSLAEQEHVTLFAVLFGAFQTLLHRYTGSADIVTGSPVSCRTSETNLIALRTDFSGDPAFRVLLDRVHNDIQEAYTHRDLPFEHLLEALTADRSTSHAPLFQVTFHLTDVRQQKGDFSRATGFDVSLEIEIRSNNLRCTLTYNKDLFEAASIQRMSGHYLTLLEGAVANPDSPVSGLPILTEAERHSLLVEWNGTHVEFPRTCVHQLFEEQVRRTPDALAVVHEGRQLTYSELNASANRLAHTLRRLGVGPEVVVAICIDRSVEMVVGLLAILKAGGAYAPLDPAYPKQRLAFMLADIEAPVLLCHKASMQGLTEHTKTVLPVEEWTRITAGQSPEDPDPQARPGNLAYVLYTSGSSGQPKGVLIPHRALTNYLMWCKSAYAPEQGRGSPVHTPIGFDLTITSLFPVLLAGRTAVLIRDDASLDALTAALRTGNFSLVKLTPAHLEALSHKLSTDERGVYTRTFVIGGEALIGESLKTWRKQTPAVRLVNEYGPTEATVGCCVYEVPAGPIPASAVPIGRPIANVKLYVLDRNLQPVPIGVAGELHIAGDGLARGYHRRPELTAEKFIRDPFSTDPEARLYKTGDLVRYRPDGNLEFLGRLDDQVKIRGFRIELSEVEATLGQHPGVREVVVAAVERAPGDRCLAAYIVPHAKTPSDAQLRTYLKERLPDYMVPASYVFLPAFPLTSNGKIDRRSLPPPSPVIETGGQPIDRARDPLERLLLQIWEEVLPARPIGVTDDFFEIGGNSLLAIRMLARVEKALARKTPLGAMFQASTIEKLAELLRNPNPVDQQVLAIQPKGSRPPFFCMSAGPMFRILARGLGSDQPFLGVALPDMHLLPPPYRLEDIATYCVKVIREKQPEGPYFLGGWSDGGVLAYEMAQQLQRNGQHVALLVLFDAENPASMQSLSAFHSARARFYFLGQWLKLHCRVLWQSGPRAVIGDVRRGLAFRLAVLKGRIWSIAYRIRLRAGWRVQAELENVEHVSAFVTRGYQPHPYDGRTLLFQCSQRPMGRYRDPQFGWGKLAGRLEVYTVPGNHMDMFLEPNVQILAEKLAACLLEAQDVRSIGASG